MQDEGKSHEAHQWKLVEYFVTNFNESHIHLFSPLDIICDDESIPRCYGQGGHFINLDFPMYVVMDSNLENGVGINNAAYDRLGIMMCLRIFKSTRNEADQEDDEDNIPHGTKVLKELALPLDNTNNIVCTY